MQLKKEPGEGSVKDETLWEFARRDVELIRAQVAIYQPAIIIGAGVAQIVAHVLGIRGDWKETKRGVRYVELQQDGPHPTQLIEYMHPSVRAKPNVICYGLLDAYREITESEA